MYVGSIMCSVCACSYVHLCVCVHSCACVCIHVHMCVHSCAYVCVYAWLHMMLSELQDEVNH